MLFPIALISLLPLFPRATVAQDEQWGIWFFSDGCHDTNGYSGIPGSQGESLTCMPADTLDPSGHTVSGPYTNIVTSKFTELGMKAILFNDTDCLQPITTIDTDGCLVIPENDHIMGVDIMPQ
ncbi:hypothetical protein GGR56DRAFT_657717 [Xylariaceae sp. FL0804]|nr:hypothetical protein GGR56DRAFT_657717 [Xylariaceae sp. FL0804]